MGMRVHEGGRDRRLRVVLARAQLVDRPDRGDPAVLDRDGALLDRLPLDRQEPVGGEECHSAAQRERSSTMSQRFSMNVASQIESSKRSNSGTTSSVSETGSTVGRRMAKTIMKSISKRRFPRTVSAVRTRSRTSARIKIGIWNASPVAISVRVTNEK